MVCFTMQVVPDEITYHLMLHYLDMVCFTIQVVPGETTSPLNATLSGHGVFYYASSTW